MHRASLANLRAYWLIDRAQRILAASFLAAAFSTSFFSQIATQQDPSAPGETAALATRSVEGRVLTKAGVPVPGAVVLIKDGKTLQVRSYIAQKEGVYHFFGLSTEVNYELRAESNGVTSKEKMLSVFDSHKVVKLDLKLTQKLAQQKDKRKKPKPSGQ